MMFCLVVVIWLTVALLFGCMIVRVLFVYLFLFDGIDCVHCYSVFMPGCFDRCGVFVFLIMFVVCIWFLMFMVNSVALLFCLLCFAFVFCGVALLFV